MDEGTRTVVDIHRHSAWANGQILNAAEQLSPEQLRTPLGEGSFGDFLATLVHTFDAQQSWFERATKGRSGPALDLESFSQIADLREVWEALDAEMETYLSGLNERALIEQVPYRSHYGSEGVYSRRDMMLHQAVHAHQHRAELALTLSKLGHSPGELDFLDYIEFAASGK
ncbi:hypothetical protein BH23CHL5_BH23CHL5_15950 [soil metagenome]